MVWVVLYPSTIDWSMVLALSTTAMAIAIIATAFYAGVQLTDIKKSRHSALLMDLIKVWDSDDFVESRRLLDTYCEGVPFNKASANIAKDAKIYDQLKQDKFYMMVRLANFFENLGLLICKGHLDRKAGMELFGSAGKKYWLLMKDIAYYKRAETDKPQADLWKHFEYLGGGCNKKDKCLKIKAAIFPIYNDAKSLNASTDT